MLQAPTKGDFPEPLLGERALQYHDTLVVADFHIGLECELREKGVNVPTQTPKLLRDLKRVLAKSTPARLLVLGDVKHAVRGATGQEYREIPRLFGELLAHCEVDVVLGNHDGRLRALLPSAVNVYEHGIALDDFYFTHGHRKLPPREHAKTVVLAHNHPCIALRDASGHVYVEHCWLRARHQERQFIILPAFNELCGNVVNRPPRVLLGPLAKKFALQNVDVYLLDGTALGTLAALQKRFVSFGREQGGSRSQGSHSTRREELGVQERVCCEKP
jgi:hypothetical protein